MLKIMSSNNDSLVSVFRGARSRVDQKVTYCSPRDFLTYWGGGRVIKYIMGKTIIILLLNVSFGADVYHLTHTVHCVIINVLW